MNCLVRSRAMILEVIPGPLVSHPAAQIRARSPHLLCNRTEVHPDDSGARFGHQQDDITIVVVFEFHQVVDIRSRADSDPVRHRHFELQSATGRARFLRARMLQALESSVK